MLNTAKSVWYYSLAVLALALAMSALVIAHVVCRLPAMIDARADSLAKLVDARAGSLQDATLAEVDKQAAGLRGDAMSAIRSAQSGILGQVHDALAIADGRLGDSLARVDGAIGQVQGIRTDLAPLLTAAGATLGHAETISAHVADAVPQFTDCAYLADDGTPIGGNPDCVFNRFQATSKAIERMSASGEKTFAAIAAEAAPTAKAVRGGAEQVTGIATDIHTITSDAVKPVPWWKKLGRIAYDGANLAARWF